MKKKKIVLLVGGMGAEREVSLSTGRGFEQALKELKYPYELIDCQADLPERLSKTKADVALLALHGKYAEDGIVQSLCEYLKIPYSGSGVLASALCMDKVFTKQILLQNEIPTPKYQLVGVSEEAIAAGGVPIEGFKSDFSFPFVVKPSREGSSVGVSIVKSSKEIRPALDLAAKYDQFLLVEEYIPGMEVTVPILDDKALTAIEIEPKVNFYTYENKYTSGKTEYHLPARLNAKVLERIEQYALHAHRVCRLRTYGRIDFRVTPEGEPYVIEINTLPGCTPTSLLPKSAKHSGISFNDLVSILIENAALDYENVK